MSRFWLLLQCLFFGHDDGNAIKFDGHGGVWQVPGCRRCGKEYR